MNSMDLVLRVLDLARRAVDGYDAPPTRAEFAAARATIARLAEQQPVAWRSRVRGTPGPWTFTETNQYAHAEVESEPLFAHPSGLATAMRGLVAELDSFEGMGSAQVAIALRSILAAHDGER